MLDNGPLPGLLIGVIPIYPNRNLTDLEVGFYYTHVAI
jgi:hypothetical protein